MSILEYTENLFSYGTLQYESVQLSTFGRKLTGIKDTLIGYRLEMVEITDPSVAWVYVEKLKPPKVTEDFSTERNQKLSQDREGFK